MQKERTCSGGVGHGKPSLDNEPERLSSATAAILVLLFFIPWLKCGAQQVTVASLDQVLCEHNGQADDDLAARLEGMELTERLSSSRLPKLLASLPGEKSRQVLTELADMSAFLDPAASEIPSTPAPGRSGPTRHDGGDITLELWPARTYINDMSFTDYHVFRSESRIILDDGR